MGERHDTLVRMLVWVQSTGQRRVAMLPDVKADYDKLENRWRKKLGNHFNHYGIPGTTLPHEHFKPLGRFPAGVPGKPDVQLFEFKAFQIRVYGVAIKVWEHETFVGLKLVDDKKKQNADQDLLRRVAKRYGEFTD